ncbi:MAG: copper chaperone PCu(A)C [Acidimicrobiales bacterium]|nr:copper chaperone PCu(A)C [Acidimicrobiales bacterium]
MLPSRGSPRSRPRWPPPHPAANQGPSTLVVDNAGASDQLLEVEVDGAERASIHRVTEAAGTEVMEEMDLLEISAGETVAMAPGEMHVMADDIKNDWVPGDRLAVDLRFRDAGVEKIEVPVVDYVELADRLSGDDRPS